MLLAHHLLEPTATPGATLVRETGLRKVERAPGCAPGLSGACRVVPGESLRPGDAGTLAPASCEVASASEERIMGPRPHKQGTC